MTLDINECSQNICHHHCTNTNGSYFCSCDTSTVLATDEIHCLGKQLIKSMIDLNDFAHIDDIFHKTYSKYDYFTTLCIVTWNPPQ